MKKILFIICSDNNSPLGVKLQNEYPYGQTDVCEWQILGMDSLYLNDINYQEIDDIYIIRQTENIDSRANDDFAITFQNGVKIKNRLKYLQSKIVKPKHKTDANLDYLSTKKDDVIELIYQKTYSAYDDYERIMTDFENIIHQEEVG